MDAHPPQTPTKCPYCGAPLQPDQTTRCWLCHGVPAAATARTAGAGQPVDTKARFQYRLSSLLLIMTLIAILSGLIAMHQGFGIVVAILALPALVRTCITATRVGRRRPAGVGGGQDGHFRAIAVHGRHRGRGGLRRFPLYRLCASPWVVAVGDPDPLAVMAGLVVAGPLAWLFGWLSHPKRKPVRWIGPIRPSCSPPL